MPARATVSLSVLVCSASNLKLNAVKSALTKMGFRGDRVATLACESGVAGQPATWAETVTGCTNRLEKGLGCNAGALDVCIAIENGVDERSGDDFAYVVAVDRQGRRACASSTSVHVPEEAITAVANAVAAGDRNATFAQFLCKGDERGGVHTSDPHQHLCGVGRAEIMALAVRVVLGQLLLQGRGDPFCG